MDRQAAYEKLKFYQDICEIRRTIYKITERFVKSHMRLSSQMKDAARSADYMSNRYIYSLYKMKANGTWKMPKYDVTSCNL